MAFIENRKPLRMKLILIKEMKMRKHISKILFVLTCFCFKLSAGINITEISVTEGEIKLQERHKLLIKNKDPDEVKLVKYQYQQGEENRIVLLNGLEFNFLTKKMKQKNGRTRIKAISNNGDKFSLTYRNSGLLGHVSLNGIDYDIEMSRVTGFSFLVKNNLTPPNLREDTLEPTGENNIKIGDEYCNIPFSNTSGESSTQIYCDEPWPPIGGGYTGPYIAKVLIVFTNDAQQHYSNSDQIMQGHADFAISQLNEYLEDSLADSHLKVELAGIYKWSYDENYLDYEECEDIWYPVYTTTTALLPKTKNNFMIAAERDRVNADIVVTITRPVPNEPNAGIAYLNPNASNAFAVVTTSYITSWGVFAHEIGHILGMRHDVDTDPGVFPYDYAHGFFDTSINKRTIMSYDCDNDPNTELCVREFKFSNPNVNFEGTNVQTGSDYAVGDCYWWGPCKANNAKVVEVRARAVSLFR